MSRQGLTDAADHVGVEPTALWAVLAVETSGVGFLPDRRPLILFERHVFSRRTAGRFDASHPDVSGPPGGYGATGAPQYERLAKAIARDRLAALESTSWGLGQIMGFNASVAGYDGAEAMVTAMLLGEDEQLLAMARFLCEAGLDRHLARKDWRAFARGYNGPAYERNRYHEKLSSAQARFFAAGLPDLDVRAVQLLLTYHGFDPGPIDGAPGPRTERAAARLRRRPRTGG